MQQKGVIFAYKNIILVKTWTKNHQGAHYQTTSKETNLRTECKGQEEPFSRHKTLTIIAESKLKSTERECSRVLKKEIFINGESIS
jgi:hypothetical protein